jgi:hypothetical protein
MTAQRGMWIAQDSNDDGTTPKGARLATGGLLAHDGASPLGVRKGVIHDGGGPVVAGTAGMSYDVRAHVAVTMASSTNGPTVIANDATVNVPTTAAPGSGSRIDVIWVRQKLITGDGGSESTNEAEYGVTQGTASGSPSAPAIPTGAMALAQTTVGVGVTATNTLVFTRAHQWTAAAGGVVRVESDTERSGITLDGTLIHYVPDNVHQVRIGGAWQPVGGSTDAPVHGLWPLTADFTTAGSGGVIVGGFAKNDTWSHADVNSYITLAGGNTWNVQKAGRYRIVMRQRWDASSSGYRHLYIRFNGSDSEQLSMNNMSAVDSLLRWEAETMPLTVGQYFQMKAYQTSSSSSLALRGNGSHTETYVYFQYLGA